MSPLRHEPDLQAGAWVAERLGTFGAVVGSLVPQGFEAYARVLHPLEDENGEPARWADVAAVTGQTLHPLAQFWRLARRPGPLVYEPGFPHGTVSPEHASAREAGRREWAGTNPETGSLAPADLARLTDLLRVATTTPQDCVMALWEGWAGAHHRPRFVLPGRQYLLYHGRLEHAGTLRDGGLADDGPRRSPSLFWPHDRAWCVASEIDLDSTVVGGSRELVDAIVTDPGLEAFAVDVGDSLMADADLVNGGGPTVA
ncbi:hypothetical protein [Actinotalea sp. K2]|uniref:hypothetical protein n=1 Tax=Actinotalea sp. K2 TaxID=2939438 RepID=UPI00201790AA|nr:hypothetical protein [Actinotalea sp. K2]MCL3859421.1 hypothetical protein [Actinotalea sp. K2]